MIAFASNSLLCRLALKQTAIDPATFTLIRIVSGALVLWLITARRSVRWTTAGSWLSAAALVAYAAAFSFAYLNLPAGTGALLLFGAVQATMILWGWRRGERLAAPQLFGIGLASLGLVVLVFPGLTSPPLAASALMAIAGIAWGIYSLRGKSAGDPVSATAGNFIRAIPFAALLAALFFQWARIDRAGVAYAIASGAITSALGYAIWYSTLPSLKAASAATVQLSVPVLAAIGGIAFLGEPLTLRLVFAAVAVLSGIAIVISNRRART